MNYGIIFKVARAILAKPVKNGILSRFLPFTPSPQLYKIWILYNCVQCEIQGWRTGGARASPLSVFKKRFFLAFERCSKGLRDVY